ncbi:major facilitator superfamily domain-containing protein [Usnea florida]
MPGPLSNSSVLPAITPAVTELPPEPSNSRNNFKHITSIIALFSTLLITALNATIMATAVPTICRDFHSAAGYAWIGGAYLLGNAAFAPIWTKFSDIWGRKAILLTAVVCFLCSSIVCAVATSMTMLIVGRTLQGISSGGLVSVISVVISDMFSMRHRSLYIGLLEIIWGFAGGIGPVLGGTFAQHLSWRWAFWIMLPPCAIAFVLLIFALEVHNPRTGIVEGLKAVDWAGSFCLLTVLIMFLLGVSFGGVEFPWNSPTVICLIVLGACMSVFFIFSEKKLARYPLLPLGIFTKKSNIAALLVVFAQHYVLYAGEYYLPLFFQSAKAVSPVKAGTLILPLALSTSLTGLLAGYYTHRTGRYVELIWLGTALMAAGHGSFVSWDATSGLGLICGTQILAGMGTGFLFAPPLIALQASVPQKEVATATATIFLVGNIATVMAVVGGQTIFQNGMDARTGELMAAGLDMQMQEIFSGSSAAANVDAIRIITSPVKRLAVEQAFAGSLRGIWILDSCLCAVGLLSCAFIVKSTLSKEHAETKTGLEDKKRPAIHIES